MLEIEINLHVSHCIKLTFLNQLIKAASIFSISIFCASLSNGRLVLFPCFVIVFFFKPFNSSTWGTSSTCSNISSSNSALLSQREIDLRVWLEASGARPVARNGKMSRMEPVYFTSRGERRSWAANTDCSVREARRWGRRRSPYCSSSLCDRERERERASISLREVSSSHDRGRKVTSFCERERSSFQCAYNGKNWAINNIKKYKYILTRFEGNGEVLKKDAGMLLCPAHDRGPHELLNANQDVTFTRHQCRLLKKVSGLYWAT